MHMWLLQIIRDKVPSKQGTQATTHRASSFGDFVAREKANRVLRLREKPGEDGLIEVFGHKRHDLTSPGCLELSDFCEEVYPDEYA